MGLGSEYAVKAYRSAEGDAGAEVGRALGGASCEHLGVRAPSAGSNKIHTMLRFD